MRGKFVFRMHINCQLRRLQTTAPAFSIADRAATHSSGADRISYTNNGILSTDH